MKYQKGHKKLGGNVKGSKHAKTLVKETLGMAMHADSAEMLDKNINDFLHDRSKKTRLIATKYFAEYFKARKKEISGDPDKPVKFEIEVTKFI